MESSGLLQTVAEGSRMPTAYFAISASSVINGIWGRFLNQEEIEQSLSLLFHIAVSTITEQFATAGASGDKTPSQEYPMYNREQPVSARASQDETSSQEYSAENHSKYLAKLVVYTDISQTSGVGVYS